MSHPPLDTRQTDASGAKLSVPTAARTDAPVDGQALVPWWVEQLARHIALAGAHPHRVRVLVPFGQLVGVLQAAWAAAHPDGFAPHVGTTHRWAMSLDTPAPATPDSWRGDAALDALTARRLVVQAGFAQDADMLAPRVLQAMHTLLPTVAAVAPSERPGWLADVRQAWSAGLRDGGEALRATLRYENAVTWLALAWAESSALATDGLFAEQTWRDVDLVVALLGLQPDPLLDSLAARFPNRVQRVPLPVARPAGLQALRLVRATGWEDEARCGAALVLQALNTSPTGDGADEQGRLAGPVALVANDRLLTRRIAALLTGSGVVVRDETGWTLSTTRVAAALIAQLQACAWDASTDDALDALKHLPADLPALAGGRLDQLEALVRRHRLTRWRAVVAQAEVWREQASSGDGGDATPTGRAAGLLGCANLVQWAHEVWQGMQATRSWQMWRQALSSMLIQLSLLEQFVADEAGVSVLRALHLPLLPATIEHDDELAEQGWPGLQQRLRLDEFTQWVRAALEGSRVAFAQRQQPQVVILPLAQLLGRAFSALVVPGCDEQHLPLAPEADNLWSPSQRASLGLPGRAHARATQEAAWAHALAHTPGHGAVPLSLVWRTTDAGGESLSPSPLVQRLLLDGAKAQDASAILLPLAQQHTTSPTDPPEPNGAGLQGPTLSASGYEALRACPYSFFAKHLLGLGDWSELTEGLDKRDVGIWLHEVLGSFHERAKQQHPEGDDARRALLDACAREAQSRLGLSDADFLPHAAAWPRLRDAYLTWLAEFEAGGARFVASERELLSDLSVPQPGPALKLKGRIDRVDEQAGDAGAPITWLIDYKTRSVASSRQLIKAGQEDTQLPFYAALMPEREVRAAYLNLNERDGVKLVEQPEVMPLSAALRQGAASEWARLAQGERLLALGEGPDCERCTVRGLCRKDFWGTP